MISTKKNSKQLSAKDLPRKITKPVNRWAILDEIEAPMWADLILECDSTYEDKDDEWFHISHPFHQSSAQQLISTFSDSPKSRGNDHKNRKQEPVVCRFTLNKQHDLKSLRSKPSFTNVGSEEATKSKILDGKLNDNLNNKSDSVGKSTLTETIKTSAKSVASGGGESNSTRSISSERKLTEVPSRPFGPTSDLLSTLGVSIRKSFVTRQASRVETKSMKQSESRKSCSIKSSVGFSTYIGCDVKNSTVTENIEKTPESRNIMTTSQLLTNKVKPENVRKKPVAKAQHVKCSSNLQIKSEDKKAMDHNKRTEAAYVTQKANERNPQIIPKDFTRARQINHPSRKVNTGKENHAGKILLDRKSTIIIKEVEGALQDPRLVKMNAHQKSDRSKLVGPRVHLFAFKL
ncbi:hypothetical protein BUALT_Bualt03G0130600 [Buddleja alternifolia]|uniref:Uncharacterized protein n=1 Tax=Buddleja alternifolia TaxID=168488 RepID=A0AAV6Y017_9LAMI|nr:hypothetical protein BUALT_Bualt03G0130600 [Buddleja alternifolia]